MIEALIFCYLAGWLVTSVGLTVAVRRLQDSSGPQPHPLPLVVAASAAWPILILGIAEFASVSAAAAVVHEDDHSLLVRA